MIKLDSKELPGILGAAARQPTRLIEGEPGANALLARFMELGDAPDNVVNIGYGQRVQAPRHEL